MNKASNIPTPPILNMPNKKQGNIPLPPNLKLASNNPIPGPPNLKLPIKGNMPAPPLKLINKNAPNSNTQKEKPKHNPSVPLRNLMWNLVKYSDVKNTIFEKIDDSKVKIDKELLEKEFARKIVEIPSMKNISEVILFQLAIYFKMYFFIINKFNVKIYKNFF